MMDSPSCPYSVSCFMMCHLCCCCKGHGTEAFRAVVPESLVWMGCTSCKTPELLWASHWGVGEESSQRHLLKGCQGEPGASHSMRQPHPSLLNNLHSLLSSDMAFPKLPIFSPTYVLLGGASCAAGFAEYLSEVWKQHQTDFEGSWAIPMLWTWQEVFLCLFSLNTQG